MITIAISYCGGKEEEAKTSVKVQKMRGLLALKIMSELNQPGIYSELGLVLEKLWDRS